MKISMLFISILSFFAAGVLNAQQNEVLNKLQDKFNSAETLSADFTQSGGKNSLKGKIFIKKDNMLRLEFPNNTIVSDGETIWNYNKRDNKVIINDYDENDPSAFSFDKIVNEYPQKSRVTSSQENGKDILLLSPGAESGLNFDNVKLWINSDNLIEKVRIEKEGSPVEINVSNYRLNENISNSQFSFTPPQGSQIIDLR